jgi:quercetin dioxygenase-like cupin family protein
MSTFQKLSELIPRRIWDGAIARAIHAERVTVGFVDLDPGILVPEHRHENEQVGFVLQGMVKMIIAGDARDLQAGDAYTIPSGVPHSAEAGPDGATVVDVFSPVRTDWKSARQLEVSPGRWPR